MRPGFFALIVVLVVAPCVTLLALLAPPAAAQELSARQQEFMTSYRNLVELQDLRGIGKLAAKDMRTTEDVIDQYCFKFTYGGDLTKLDEIRLLATAADEAEQGKRFQNRFERFKTYEAEQCNAWTAARNSWVKSGTAFNEANQKKEIPEFRRAMIGLEETLELAIKVKDPELTSLVRYYVGLCHELLGEYPEVVTCFDVAMDEWLTSGRPKDGMYQHMVDKRRELIEKGMDPLEKGKAAGAPGTTKKDSTTAYKDGCAWQDWSTDYREMKEPNQIASTSPWGCDHVLLWREFTWSEGAHPLGLLVNATPFGKPLTLVRDGAKGFFDIDGDKKESKGDQPCKVIDGKPTLNTVRSGDGKESESCAFFMLSGGAGQTWFQSPVNYTGSGRYKIGCYREGKILDETILLVDDNCSGSIGDPSEQRDGVVHGNPTWMDNDTVVIGKGKPQPWSDVLPVAGKWYHFKPVDLHAKKLRTRELDIASGQVVFKWSGLVQPKMLVLAEIQEFKGSFFDVAGGKPVSVPVGRYEIAYGRIESGKAAQTKQAWIFKGDSPAFDVKAGETFTLDMGGPYKVDFATDDQGKSLIVKSKSLVVKEKTGAIVGRIYDEILYYEVAARHKGGGAMGKPKAMARISTEIFNTDNEAAWYPADFVIEKAEKAEVEVQLSLKKHTMLGGPFTSEWK